VEPVRAPAHDGGGVFLRPPLRWHRTWQGPCRRPRGRRPREADLPGAATHRLALPGGPRPIPAALGPQGGKAGFAANGLKRSVGRADPTRGSAAAAAGRFPENPRAFPDPSETLAGGRRPLPAARRAPKHPATQGSRRRLYVRPARPSRAGRRTETTGRLRALMPDNRLPDRRPGPGTGGDPRSGPTSTEVDPPASPNRGPPEDGPRFPGSPPRVPPLRPGAAPSRSLSRHPAFAGGSRIAEIPALSRAPTGLPSGRFRAR
jgi:hypothetical protein